MHGFGLIAGLLAHSLLKQAQFRVGRVEPVRILPRIQPSRTDFGQKLPAHAFAAPFKRDDI
jgi:hypothetical protein